MMDGGIHGGETPTLLKMRVDRAVGKGTNLIIWSESFHDFSRSSGTARLLRGGGHHQSKCLHRCDREGLWRRTVTKFTV